MAQFRNKGWVYFDQFEEIIPNAKARGSHAFSLMNAAPPSQLLEEDAVNSIYCSITVNHRLTGPGKMVKLCLLFVGKFQIQKFDG